MLARAAVIFTCFVVASVAITRAERTESTPLRSAFAVFPMQLGDWRATQNPPFDESILKVLGVDDYLTRIYRQPDRSVVGVYVGYWQSQRQGDAIHSPLNCLPGAGWEPLSKSTLGLDVMHGGAPTRIHVNRYVVQKGLDKQLVLYWYQSHGRTIASEYASKLFLVVDSVRLHRSDAALVRITVPVVREDADAEARAERTAVRFVETVFPVLDSYLPL
jgi:EpsI family protein